MITSDKTEPAKDPAAPLMQLLSLASGSKLAELSVGLAVAGMGDKQRQWLEKRGRLDEGTARMLDARIAGDHGQTRRAAREVIAMAAIPAAQPGGMAVGGQVTKQGQPQGELVVSLVDRAGKAVDCTRTDGAGLYKLRNTTGAECLVMVSTASGTRRLKLDDRPVIYRDSGAAVRNIELAGKPSCPDGPDTSERAVMPAVVGLQLDAAKALLAKHKIKLSGVRSVNQAGASGMVIASDPPAGRLLEEKPSAVLTIVIGTDPHREPKPEQDTAPKDPGPPRKASTKSQAAKPRTSL